MLTGRHATLTAQIIRRTLLLSVIAIIAIVVALISLATVVTNDAEQKVNDVNADATREIDLFVKSVEADLHAVVDAFAGTEVVDEGLRAVLRRHDEILDVRYIDPSGDLIGQRRRGAMTGAQGVTEQPWLNTVQAGETYVGTVDFEESGVPFVNFAVPARTASGEFVGTLVARLDLTSMWQTVIGITVGEEGYVYIVNEDGRLLVYSDLEKVQQGFNIKDESGLLPSEINAASGLGPAFLGLTDYTGITDQPVLSRSRRLNTAPWYVVVEQPQREIFYDYVPLFAALLAALLISIGVVWLTLRFLNRQVASPLREIIQGTQVLASGDLSYRIEATQGAQDLNTLGTTLNTLAEDLERTNQRLEARVEARTRDLQLALRVSEQISTMLDPEVLLPQVVELTAEYFDLYHAHVYLLDTEGENLVMAAGLGEAGRVMRERGHRIPLNATLSVVARAAREQSPVIVDDTRAEPGFLANPLLPKTRSEAAIPLVAGQRVVGVLDVQSERPGHFGEDLISVLLTMAGQIGVAIINARLFSEVERTSRRELAVGTVTQAIQQATSIDEVLQIAARELGQALRVPHTAIELQLGAVDSDTDADVAAPHPTAKALAGAKDQPG